ncbi:hypothetical protein GUITHDRAFT_139720 [Guillardia theta CCMP2712]|uniref:Uncharacterized protein n=1 Tax=Guillardia theta (strain CCMP2712) TaxID=905079 RepID=L1J8T5_GUITC|nr:hypothetical protein GUITHDRAFT_139720 [Guillardia theta CCMP2712]EKX44480.1 hypothetical protein GUITHDRAFT_139720 [Guillardia theta CCMP2712]|eukprot:XP_005831460.1 hypothetical protein GUITHDRAFT_139720 [Guillardia theta CCMP2712]
MIWRKWSRRQVILSLLSLSALIPGSAQYTCTHLSSGISQTAPCSINVTYSAYEDHEYGDGGRGGQLFGAQGPNGFTCNIHGECKGSLQQDPLQLLGTDSLGCCCSSGTKGLGLDVGYYQWTPATIQHYRECSTSVSPEPCVPEACEFEVIGYPGKGTLHAITEYGGRGSILGPCSQSSPCKVPPRFNTNMPAVNGQTRIGRFQNNILIFKPLDGDVGQCSQTNFNCIGFTANLFWESGYEDLFLYTSLEFQVRSFTWKYSTDHIGIFQTFRNTIQDNYVQLLEDRYQRYLHQNETDLFYVQGCPCIEINSMSFECNAVNSNCSLNGTSGRILIIDFRSMAAIDGGLCLLDSASVCTGLQPELSIIYSAINNGSVVPDLQ